MQPKNKLDDQEPAPKRTFIEQARRAQIIEATIDVLADQGYVHTSFARIAERASISPGLISYHFKDKDELTREVYYMILTRRVGHIQEKVAEGATATDQLRIAIESDMAFMGTQPRLFKALIEVLFSVRDGGGVLTYMGKSDYAFRSTLTILTSILEKGQQNGEFADFDIFNLALIFDSARDQFLAQLPLRADLDLEAFTQTLVKFALKAVRKEQS